MKCLHHNHIGFKYKTEEEAAENRSQTKGDDRHGNLEDRSRTKGDDRHGNLENTIMTVHSTFTYKTKN